MNQRIPTKRDMNPGPIRMLSTGKVTAKQKLFSLLRFDKCLLEVIYFEIGKGRDKGFILLFL